MFLHYDITRSSPVLTMQLLLNIILLRTIVTMSQMNFPLFMLYYIILHNSCIVALSNDAFPFSKSAIFSVYTRRNISVLKLVVILSLVLNSVKFIPCENILTVGEKVKCSSPANVRNMIIATKIRNDNKLVIYTLN